MKTEAIGLNFADVYRRRGDYHLEGKPPYIAGYEAAGVIESIAGDSDLRVGDRVGFADAPHANAERVAVAIEKLIPLPDDITAEVAAAVLLQGLTAQYLVTDSHALRAGETALVHAAAGGVGLLLVQLAKARGVRVLGLTSSPEKARSALQHGADAIALYSEEWPTVAREFSPGGVDVVLRLGRHDAPRQLRRGTNRRTRGLLWDGGRQSSTHRSPHAHGHLEVADGRRPLERPS